MEKLRHIASGQNVVPLKAPELTNDALVQRLIEGDPLAATVFYDRFGSRINRWVWRLLGADQDHDEVVQQVFIGVLSSLPTLKDPEVLEAFVDSVTMRTARKEIRRRRFKRRLFGKASDTVVEETRDHAHPMKAAHIRRFYAILDDMPADDRVVFVLRHLEGLSLGAIARRGNCSLSTAKRCLKRATTEFKTRALKDPVLLTMLEEYRHAT